MSGDALNYGLSAFGMTIASDFPVAGAVRREASRTADLLLKQTERDELEELAGELRHLRYLNVYEGSPYAMLEGAAGDVLFHYRQRALFHLSADLTVLRCAPSSAGMQWQRVLMDTVLWTVSFLRGFELLHSSAVRTPEGVIAFAAESGGGKTTLAAELIRRGCHLVCDDILALDDPDGALQAYPGPLLMNLPRQLSADRLGSAAVLDRFGDEQWVQLDATPQPPQPVAGVVLIARGGGKPRCERVAATSLTMLPYLVSFPHLADRARRQFEVAGELAAVAVVLRLTAEPAAEAAHLADLVLEAVGRP